MAKAEFIPTVWSARFLDILDRTNVWSSVANRNYEGEISAFGDRVKIPGFTTQIQVGDYVRDTPITAAPQTTDGETQELVIDQSKFFRFFVDSLDAAQSRPDLMDAAMSRAAVAISQVKDDFYAGLVNAAHADARSMRITTARHSDGWGKSFIEAVNETAEAMDLQNIPEDGRWIILGPRALRGFERYLLTGAVGDAFRPATSDEALRNGFVGRLLNFDLRKTTNVPSLAVSSVNYDRNWVGQGTGNLTIGDQVERLVPYEPENLFGDAVKGLYGYGGKLIFNNSDYSANETLWNIETNQATT